MAGGTRGLTWVFFGRRSSGTVSPRDMRTVSGLCSAPCLLTLVSSLVFNSAIYIYVFFFFLK